MTDDFEVVNNPSAHADFEVVHAPKAESDFEVVSPNSASSTDFEVIHSPSSPPTAPPPSPTDTARLGSLTPNPAPDHGAIMSGVASAYGAEFNAALDVTAPFTQAAGKMLGRTPEQIAQLNQTARDTYSQMAPPSPDHPVANTIGRTVGGAAPILAATALGGPVGGAVAAATVSGTQGIGSAVDEGAREGYTASQTASLATERGAFNAILGLIPGSAGTGGILKEGAKAAAITYLTNLEQARIEAAVKQAVGIESDDAWTALKKAAFSGDNAAQSLIFGGVHAVSVAHQRAAETPLPTPSVHPAGDVAPATSGQTPPAAVAPPPPPTTPPPTLPPPSPAFDPKGPPRIPSAFDPAGPRPAPSAFDPAGVPRQAPQFDPAGPPPTPRTFPQANQFTTEKRPPVAPDAAKASLERMTPPEVARYAQSLGIAPKSKAENIAAIMEKTNGQHPAPPTPPGTQPPLPPSASPGLAAAAPPLPGGNDANRGPAPVVAPAPREGKNAPLIAPPEPTGPAKEIKPPVIHGERHEGSAIGSKTAPMFGDVSKGPASKLEEAAPKSALEKKFENTQSGDMFGKVMGHGSSGAKKEIAARMWGDKSTLKNDVVPAAAEAASALTQAASDIRRTLAPQTGGTQARVMAGIAREHGAELAQRTDRAAAALDTARRFFDGQSNEHNLTFIDAVENGRPMGNPELNRIAATMRELLDGRRREVQSLGKNKLANFIENYFPHIWKDEKNATAIFSQAKRPLEGAKSFLKHRTIPTTAEGIKAGLEPLSHNPVELTLLKVREMDKYILGQRMLNEMKGKGLAKFVRATESAPDGYKKIDDRIATVYGPPTVKTNEYVNSPLYEALESVAGRMGVRHTRTANPEVYDGPRASLGYSVQGGNKIATRSGTDLAVLAHEISHQLDYKHDLQSRFLKGRTKAFQDELRALADLHTYKKSYFRTGPEKMATLLESYVRLGSEQMHQVAPTVHHAFMEFMKETPALQPLLKMKPNLAETKLTSEIPHGGLLKMGEYYAPEKVADVINNYLSPGLRGKSALFRGFLGAGNVLNQAQLGLSAFHLGFTSLDAATSKMALAFNYLADGKIAEFGKSLAATPLAPVENMVRGNKVLREWYRPGSQGAEMGRIVDAMKAAGGRAKMDSFYQTGAVANMMKAFRQGNVVGGIMRTPLAGMELAAKPIMEYIVPRQKMGIFADMARRELGKLPEGATRDHVREAMGKAWDSVDNRMGQMVYDNLMWNKVVKDLSMASVRSVGWNLGTIRELGGGVLDIGKAMKEISGGKRPEFSYRMAYVAALPILAGTLGAMTQYLYTGKGPEELKDYFFPKTGEVDEEGREKRVALPSYMKDVYAYAHSPLGTLSHKLHPLISTAAEMLENRDYYGTKIRNEDDPWMKQIADAAKYAGGQFVPFGVRNAMQESKDGESGTQGKVMPFVGVTPAPKHITMTAAEELAAEKKRETMPAGSRTTEQADKGRLKSELRRGLKANTPGADERIQQAVKAGSITDQDAKDLHSEAGESYLQRMTKGLPLDAALKVYDKGSPEEKASIHDIVRDHIVRSDQQPQDQDKLMAEHKITPPADLALDREYADLQKKATADEKKKQQMESLTRQVRAAEQEKEWDKGAALRKEYQAISKQPQQLTGRDRARHEQLQQFRTTRGKLQQMVKEGSMPEDSAERRLAGLRGRL